MATDPKSRTHSVGALATLSGVSIRTLHHYHAIGLLKPAWVGEQGYRYYGREELLRLQQILFHRELGMSLTAIGELLDGQDFDRLSALRRQRMHILAEGERQRQLLNTIDRSIAELEGRQEVDDSELYKGCAPERQTEYEAFIADRYGDEAREHIHAGRKRMSQMTPAEVSLHMDELVAIEAALATARAAGAMPGDHSLDSMFARHHCWITLAWGSPPSPQAYAGLGSLYASHPDFVARFEHLQPGFAKWLEAGMAAFADRQLE